MLFLDTLPEDIIIYNLLPLCDEKSIDNLKEISEFLNRILSKDLIYENLININYKNVNKECMENFNTNKELYFYLLNCDIYKCYLYNEYLFDVAINQTNYKNLVTYINQKYEDHAIAFGNKQNIPKIFKYKIYNLDLMTKDNVPVHRSIYIIKYNVPVNIVNFKSSIEEGYYKENITIIINENEPYVILIHLDCSDEEDLIPFI